MKRLNHGTVAILGAAALAICGLTALTGTSHAQVPGGYGQQGYGQPAYGQPTPSAPLAGGMAATQGGQYMDVRGNSIVMPAQYCQNGGCQDGQCYGGDCYGGECYGGDCYGGAMGCGPYAGGASDGVYADFGGYGQDVCGPYYFDVAFDYVALFAENRFDNLPAFLGTAGVNNTDRPVLNAAGEDGDLVSGWQVALRHDLGPLSVLEATYMGVYDLGFEANALSVEEAAGGTDFQLFSVFSNFGLGTTIPGLDFGRQYTLRNDSDLQSTEFSYRRYWVGHNPRFSGTLLAGFRYVRYTDDLTLASTGLVAPATIATATRTWSGDNDLLGGQIGGDMMICLRQGLRLGMESKAGVYNNRFKFRNSGTFSDPGTADFAAAAKGNQIAFVGEANANIIADIWPSVSLRFGYKLLYLNSVVSSGDSIDTTNFFSTTFADQADALFHGFTGGIEYIW